MTPVRFALDSARLPLSWITGEDQPQSVQEKARRFLWCVERIAITAVVFFGLKKLRSNTALDEFSFFCSKMVYILPETRLSFSLYCIIYSMRQIFTYTNQRIHKGHPPVRWALYGIVHLILGLCFLRWYDHIIDKSPFHREFTESRLGKIFPRISSGVSDSIRAVNDYTAQGMTYLITGRTAPISRPPSSPSR